MKKLLLVPGFISALSHAAQIVDFHVHIHEEHEHSVSGLLQSMEQNQISKSVVLSDAYAQSGESDARVANDYIANQTALHPDKLIGFCATQIKADWFLAEAKRCFEVLNLKGLKLHFGQEQFTFKTEDDVARLESLAALSAKYHVPILFHPMNYSREEMRVVTRTALKYPDANFVMAHAYGYSYRELLPLGEYLAQEGVPENFFIETSTFFETYEDAPEMDDIVWYFEKFGIKRILFGSDWNGYAQEAALRAFHKYPFSSEQKEAILFKNAEKLLRINP